MAQQGWYPDPGGETGMFRYWDGTAWSEVLSSKPLPGPPAPVGPTGLGAGAGSAGTQPLVVGQSRYGYSQVAPDVESQQTPYIPSKPKRSVAPWITLGVGVVVVGVIIGFVVNWINQPFNPAITEPPISTGPTTQVCPKQPAENTRAEHPGGGRVYGGQLSYPILGEPWGPVQTSEIRVPFGRDVAEQTIFIHSNPSPKLGDWEAWVASVEVAELYAGDGFYSPQEGSQIVNKCIFGAFYGNTELGIETLRSEPFTVDGYEGWITETNLSFSIPNLPTTSELAIVIIVKTSEMSSSLFYASIPNDAMQFKPDVDWAIENLRVGS